MSFSKEKQLAIQNYILEKIASQDTKIANKTAKAFDCSLNTVYRYFKDLEKNKIIFKEKNSQYRLVNQELHFELLRSKGQLIHEDEIYFKYFEDRIKMLPDNVVRIWSYSFSEMVNNVIDHSQAECMSCDVYSNKLATTTIIHDNGVGIFKHIKDSLGFGSLEETVQELFKGKLTTDTKHHSGEGIFFTSRMMDFFAVLSDGLIFTHDNFEEAITEVSALPGLENWQKLPGTTIVMSLSNTSKKSPGEIFHLYEDEDYSFTKTNIRIKNLFGAFPVSRSQAKRLCRGLDAFSEVTLDFTDVDEIGQGFAHEVFSVYLVDHPETLIKATNTNANVDAMIKHVTRH